MSTPISFGGGLDVDSIVNQLMYVDRAPERLIQGQQSALTINVDSGTDTLASLRDAINAAGTNVQALVINDGKGSRLTLTSLTSGEAGAITLSNFSAPALQSSLGFTETSPARDAQFSIN